MSRIITLIVWFFIIVGAIVATRICLIAMNPEDNTSIAISLALINIIWIVIGVEIKEKLIK